MGRRRIYEDDANALYDAPTGSYGALVDQWLPGLAWGARRSNLVCLRTSFKAPALVHPAGKLLRGCCS